MVLVCVVYCALLLVVECVRVGVCLCMPATWFCMVNNFACGCMHMVHVWFPILALQFVVNFFVNIIIVFYLTYHIN